MNILLAILQKEETSLAEKHFLLMEKRWKLPAKDALCWKLDINEALIHNDTFIKRHFLCDGGVAWKTISFPKYNFYLTSFPDGSKIWFSRYSGWKYVNIYHKFKE